MLELGIPNNRKFKENFEKYKQDTKNKDAQNERHIFKNNVKYMISSTMFFVLIVAVAIIGMYDLLIISKTFDYRIILYLGLTAYGMYGFFKIYSHKIIVENKSILYGFIFSNFIFCIVCKVKNGKTTIINNIPINVNSNKLEGLLSKNKYPKIGVNT
mgnify:CR=1 FL=1